VYKYHACHKDAEDFKFTRGWTLQELVAPNRLEFLDSSWIKRGSKEDHAKAVSKATGIQESILHFDSSKDIHEKLREIPVSVRMSWASKRKTTRTEDIAYCLLGLFGVHMPLLYGEGSNAFRRLQEEIATRTTDMSLLAWESPPGSSKYVGAFAPSVQCFQNMKIILPSSAEFTVTSRGLKVQSGCLLKIQPNSDDSQHLTYAIPLGASPYPEQTYLEIARVGPGRFVRIALITPWVIGKFWLVREFSEVNLYLELDPIESTMQSLIHDMRRWVKFDMQQELQVIHVFPGLNWEWSNNIVIPGNRSAMVLSLGTQRNAMMFVVALFDWSFIDHVYIAEYSSPAAQHILHSLNYMVKADLEQIWHLSPGVVSQNGKQWTNSHRIRGAEGILTVDITGEKCNVDLTSTQVAEIFISSSFNSEKDS
jgi:hypothetical protein